MESSALNSEKPSGVEDDQKKAQKPLAELQGESGDGGHSRRQNPGLEIARQYDVHPNQIQDWKKKLMSEAEKLFENGSAHTGSGGEEKVQELHAKIGELTMERDFLSKALGRDR